MPEETNSERMISLRLLTAPEIKLIGKLLLLGLKNGTAFYIESRIGSEHILQQFLDDHTTTYSLRPRKLKKP